MRPRTIIQGILCLFLLMLSYATVAQDIVGPDGPDDPSTLEKYITVTQHENGTILPKGKDGKVTLIREMTRSSPFPPIPATRSSKS